MPRTVGRELLLINDKRLSRKQLQVHIGASISVTRLGANASFIQAAAGEEHTELPRDESVTLQPSAILWISQQPDSREYQYPARIAMVADAADPPAVSAPADAALPAAPPAPAPAPGVWHVRLGGAFRPYDPPVQLALEAAFMAGEYSTCRHAHGQHLTQVHRFRTAGASHSPTATGLVCHACMPCSARR